MTQGSASAIVGVLSAGDSRMRATIEAVSDRLTDERGFVYRYLCDDGLDGEEGTFAICTFWLAHCWALLGDMQRAREVFDRLAACSNDVGLLAEEIAPHSTRLLGNFPKDSGDDHGCRKGPPACQWVPAGASAPDVIVDKDFGITRELVVAPIGRSAITPRP